MKTEHSRKPLTALEDESGNKEPQYHLTEEEEKECEENLKRYLEVMKYSARKDKSKGVGLFLIKIVIFVIVLIFFKQMMDIKVDQAYQTGCRKGYKAGLLEGKSSYYDVYSMMEDKEMEYFSIGMKASLMQQVILDSEDIPSQIKQDIREKYINLFLDLILEKLSVDEINDFYEKELDIIQMYYG